MSNYDERVNDEADEHAQMMNKGRPINILELIELKRNEIKDDNNEK